MLKLVDGSWSLVGLYSYFIQFYVDRKCDDILWTPNIREKDEDVAARGMKFWKWWARNFTFQFALIVYLCLVKGMKIVIKP